LSCIDSRASAELIFEQRIGDIFSARVAGNVVNDDILGSLEFAGQVVGAKLAVVVGHSACSAVMGAGDRVELGNLTSLLAKIAPAVDSVEKPHQPEARTSAHTAFVEAVGRENVRRSVESLRADSQFLRELEASGENGLAGACYDVETGAVEFLF